MIFFQKLIIWYIINKLLKIAFYKIIVEGYFDRNRRKYMNVYDEVNNLARAIKDSKEYKEYLKQFC